MKKCIIYVILALIITNICSVTVLFDRTKDELAGNADWTIGYSPNWTGGYSEFGQALRDLGYNTQTLTGSNISSSDLQNVDVFVIPEPQESFSYSERNAILNFVDNGGGLFIIANHVGSDRSNNGWDSPRVYNESLNIQSNFGFSFVDVGSLYVDPITMFESPRGPITEGLSSVGMYAGSAIEVTGTDVVTNVYLRNFNESGMVSLEYGSGRVVAWGDSSPWDDGTGNSGNNLYDGWTDHDNAQWGLNVIAWLAGEGAPQVETNFANVNFPQEVAVGNPINVSCNISAVNANVTRAYLYWNTGSGFHPTSMTSSGTLFNVTIPAQEEATEVSFYIQAILSNNQYGYFPEGAPNELETIVVSPVSNYDDVEPIESIFSVYPNPCNLNQQDLKISTNKEETIKIYDIKGRLIERLVVQNEKTFNKGDLSSKLNSGTYIFKTNDHVQKVSIIK